MPTSVALPLKCLVLPSDTSMHQVTATSIATALAGCRETRRVIEEIHESETTEARHDACRCGPGINVRRLPTSGEYMRSFPCAGLREAGPRLLCVCDMHVLWDPNHT